MQRINSPAAWSQPSDTLDLQFHQVDIWRARLDLPRETISQLAATLSADETQRAARFHFPRDTDRFIAARGCLRDILARYLHCKPDQLTFSANDYGKPVLNNHTLEFNLSHSGDFALVALTQERKVGVDLELIRQGISSQVIAQQYFSKSEVAELQELPPEQRETAFFTCWTRKEAYIKAQGFGLSLPLESFDVSLTPDEPAVLRATRTNPHEAGRWMLLSLHVDSEYAGALAVESATLAGESMSKSQRLEFRLWEWGWSTND